MENSKGNKPNKDVSSRRKCPECDGRIAKESNKSKSRVWKRVMWFTRRSKGSKNDVCQCQLTDESFSSSMEERHSNSWSFTRSASKKFRFSSRRRQCKSESTKKPFRVQGNKGKSCLSHENLPPLSVCTSSVSSSGANSPTATGSFCDFGATCHSGGKGTKRLKNAFVLSEIAREINPPVKREDMPLIDTHSPVKKLCKSSSSVSYIFHPQINLMSTNVRRSKSFPGSQGYVSPSKRRLMNTANKTLASFSPPLKQKCYGLRRTATFSGKLNAEFPKISMKKSKSINNAELMNLGKSSSLGEIRDQSGSIVGIVHFYKSPNTVVSRRLSNVHQEVKKDCVFVEEDTEYKTVDQTNSNIISQEGHKVCANCSTFNKTYVRGCDEIDVGDHTLCDSESDILCNNSDVFNVTEDCCCKNVNHGPFGDVNVSSNGDSLLEVYTDNEENHISTTDCFLSRSKRIIQDENVEKSYKPGSVEQENSLSKELNPDTSSNQEAVTAAEFPCEDCISNRSILETEPVAKPQCELGTAKQSSQNVELSRQPLQDCLSDDCNGCDSCHGDIDQMLIEPLSNLISLEQTSEDIAVTQYANASDIETGNLSQNFCDSVSDKCDGRHLVRREKCIFPKPCQNSEILGNMTFKIDAEIQPNGSKQCANEFTEKVPGLCSKDATGISSLCEKTENGFCRDGACLSNASTDSFRSWEDEISIDDVSSLGPIASDNIPCNDKCQLDESECHGNSLEVITTSHQSDMEHCNDIGLNHDCPSIVPVDDLEVLDDRFNIDNVPEPFASQEKLPMHSGVITSSKNRINSPTMSRESVNNFYEECSTYKANVLCLENRENLRTVDKPVTSSPCASAEVRDCSKTSDYVSILDEKTFSPSQNDVPIHTWKTSESDLKSDEIGLPVPGETFKMRTELMLSWFEEFNDEQRNIILKKILNRCELPQMHLLSVAMEHNLHKTCPPNCQDMLVWLPYTVTLKILTYLDPVSLCRCNQVNRAWNELTDNPILWQRLTRSPDYQLSEASSKRQYQKFTLANGEIHWKKVFAERFLLQRNWLDGTYKLRTFQGHNQGIACVQFDDTRIVSGSSDKTIKLWDISNMPSELMLTLEGHSGTVRCLDLNGNRLVSGSTDRTIKVWDLSFASYWAGASCKVTMVGHLHTVRCLQADEKKLVSGSYDKTVKVWDLKTGECQLTLRGHTAAVLCVQFDDQKIVSGSYDKKIKVWDLTEGSCLLTLDGHQDAVTCLNLTHDGMKIITGSLDYSLKFWDLSTGKCYGTLDWITSEGHTAVVRCLQVDSWRIVSGGDDKTLKVWELATGQRLLTLRYHSDGVTCMQFNDFAIVSGSYDRTVKLWDFTPKHPYLETTT